MRRRFVFLYVKAWRQAARAGAGPPGPRRPRLLALLCLVAHGSLPQGCLWVRGSLWVRGHTRVPGWGGRRGKGQAGEVTSELV